MKFVALLAAIVLIPIAATGGYMANPDPPSPKPLTLDQALSQTLTAVGQPQITYMYVVTKGKLKGQTGDPIYVASQTKAQLAAQGALAGQYIRMVCQLYTAEGNDYISLSSSAAQYCKRTVVTKARALKGEPVS